MKKFTLNLITKIEDLCETIEMGFLTKGEAMNEIRDFQGIILDKFEEGSNEYMQCMAPLCDAHNIATEI